MARPLRICIPGGLYHVTVRGNARELIYRGDDDRELFLEILEHATDRYSLLCHGYCLMGNHYHLILETPRANLPVAMRQLNGLYARRYNLRHGRCSHVFQARYRSILVEKESHLDGLARYVDLNPVRAGICTDPAELSRDSRPDRTASLPRDRLDSRSLRAHSPARPGALSRLRRGGH
jgi:putative transposase